MAAKTTLRNKNLRILCSFIAMLLFSPLIICQETINIDDYLLSKEYRLHYLKWEKKPIEFKKQNINDTIYLAQIEPKGPYPERIYIDNSIPLEIFFISNTEYSASCYKNYHSIQLPTKDQKSALSRLVGRYTELHKINSQYYIAPPNYFCDNKSITITDSTLLYKTGCEGWRVQQLQKIEEPQKGIIEIFIPNHSYRIHSIDESAGIILVESNIHKKEYFYMVNESHADLYPRLRCESNSGPCSPKVKNYLRKLNLIELLQDSNFKRNRSK